MIQLSIYVVVILGHFPISLWLGGGGGAGDWGEGEGEDCGDKDQGGGGSFPLAAALQTIQRQWFRVRIWHRSHSENLGGKAESHC